MPRPGALFQRGAAADGALATSSQGADAGLASVAAIQQTNMAQAGQDGGGLAGLRGGFGGGGVGGGAPPVPPFALPRQQSALGAWMPSRSTFVFFLVALHLGALCYWCYLMWLSHRRAKAAAAARGEPRLPPPKVNCTYDWSALGEADPESKGFFARFRLKPLLDRKNSGRPVLRSELATMGILGAGVPSSRARITRTPTLPSTPELV